MDGRPDLASGPLKIENINVLNAIFNLILKIFLKSVKCFATRPVGRRQPLDGVCCKNVIDNYYCALNSSLECHMQVKLFFEVFFLFIQVSKK